MNHNNDIILELADRCVKCGLCLPQCPTYHLSRNENESPRGRIALIQALVRHELEATDDTLYQHLDNCLLCRRCERICPSGVEYGRIMDMARQQINQARPASRLHKFGQQLLSQHMQTAYHGLRLYQQSGAARLLRPLLRQNKKLAWLQDLIPSLPGARKFKPHYPVSNSLAGHVAIFTGCMGKNADAQTLAAGIDLLHALGYRISLPPKQGCCGALQQHSGQADESQTLARNNLQAFGNENYTAVLYLASGCGAQLMDYPQLNWSNAEEKIQAGQFQTTLEDMTGFIATALQKNPLPFAALEKRVMIHQPCSQRNALRLPDQASRLLAHIPGIRLSTLPDDTPCCGAAGDYMLRHPQQAQRLRQHLLDKLLADKVDIIVSTNIGCSLFIQTGLENKAIRVIHPIQLLREKIQE
ncbi:Glycolate dehydrogenase, iron-sulfur subunit GlcF [hydrothermal vent metagenome]|uniref:Glycolate dehydrogenase, iron-sulfur subunit GlcF n=1 Tax=hydrothermal vent metagenome TaxID=652676 RepID=A0A3B1B9I5_9ZZZZ